MSVPRSRDAIHVRHSRISASVPDSTVERTLAAQALLAGIAERGADAVGYAYGAASTGRSSVTKLRGGASALLDELALPAPRARRRSSTSATSRRATPRSTANNHPIRHGAVVGIHNGVIENDDALLARYGIEREEPNMTVDSEAIFALVEHHRHDDPRPHPAARGDGRSLDGRARPDDALPRARASAPALDRPERGRLLLRLDAASAQRSSRPHCELVCASRGARGSSSPRGVDGRIVRERRFRPDRRYREEDYLPPVRAPREAVSCLERLACLAAACCLRSDPSGKTSTPRLARRSRTRNWNAVQAPRGTSSSR